MESFNTLEKVKELFNSVGCEGNENCYFVALKDYKKYSYIVSNDEKGIIEAFRYIENKGKQIGKTHIDYEYKNEEIINKITEIIERK